MESGLPAYGHERLMRRLVRRQLARHMAAGGVSAPVCWFGLHGLDSVHCSRLLAGYSEHRPFVLVEYSLAERNLELPAALVAQGVERCAGAAHYARFCHFMRRGALEGLLATMTWPVVHRYRLAGGAVLGAVCGPA